MVSLLDLSTELILCVASHMRQLDLLNISLTCQCLRATTERKLFREYNNRMRCYSRPVAQFVYRILRKPEIAPYVKSVNIIGHDDSRCLNREHHGLPAQNNPAYKLRTVVYMSLQSCKPSEEEYYRLTMAAKAVGIIDQIYPYGSESIFPDISSTIGSLSENCLLLDLEPVRNLPYQQKFCHLRAGVDEAYTILLFAILPNLDNISLGMTRAYANTLEWLKPNFGFRALRRLSATGADPYLVWPFGLLNTKLGLAANLDEIMLYNTGSTYVDEESRVPLCLHPGSLHVTKLEIVNFNVRTSDMQNLIHACPRLKILRYYTDPEWTEPGHINAQEIVAMLTPLCNTLEELYLGIARPCWLNHDDFKIKSLSLFRTLVVLDTTPIMWHRMMSVDFDEEEIHVPAAHLLTNRLPPSLSTLIIHAAYDPPGVIKDSIHVMQLDDLVANHAARLPNLRHVFIGFLYPEQVDPFLVGLEEPLDNLEFHVVYGTSALTTHADGDEQQRIDSPLIEWCSEDNAYSDGR